MAVVVSFRAKGANADLHCIAEHFEALRQQARAAEKEKPIAMSTAWAHCEMAKGQAAIDADRKQLGVEVKAEGAAEETVPGVPGIGEVVPESVGGAPNDAVPLAPPSTAAEDAAASEQGKVAEAVVEPQLTVPEPDTPGPVPQDQLRTVPTPGLYLCFFFVSYSHS